VVKYVVISGKKLIFRGFFLFQSQGPVLFGQGPGPKTKILSFLTSGNPGAHKDKTDFAGNMLQLIAFSPLFSMTLKCFGIGLWEGREWSRR